MKKILLFCISVIFCAFIFNSCTKSRNVETNSYSDSIGTYDTVVTYNHPETDSPHIDTAVISNLKPLFKESNDEFSENIWVEPKNEPKYRNINATYMYFAKNDGIASNLRFVLQYESDDWLFIESIIFNVDGKVFNFCGLDFETDCGNGGRIWEWCDINFNDNELADALLNSKKVKIKMIGSQYYETRVISTKDLNSIKNTIKYYKALGGEIG